MFSKRVKLVLIFFGVFFVLVLIYLPGFSRYRELKRKELEIAKEMERLRDSTLRLSEEEKLLEGDKEYLEAVVRENLGRVREGEVVYRVLRQEDGKAPREMDEKQETLTPST